MVKLEILILNYDIKTIRHAYKNIISFKNKKSEFSSINLLKQANIVLTCEITIIGKVINVHIIYVLTQ